MKWNSFPLQMQIVATEKKRAQNQHQSNPLHRKLGKRAKKKTVTGKSDRIQLFY